MAVIEDTTAPAQGRSAAWCLAAPVAWSVGGTLAIWSIARLGDVDLVVGTGAAAQTVGWPAVAAVSAVASAAGMLLLLFLQRRFRKGRAWWTAIATAVLLVSLSGPLGAATWQAMIPLAAMHVTVWLALATAAWRRC